MRKYKVLDLFAGAGGLSLGFSQTDRFETVMAVEINKQAAKTYTKNHKIEVTNQDIQSIIFKDYDKFPNLKDVSIVIGGPPCQGFSNANRQKSELFSSNNLLVKEFVRVINEIKPQAFIMENVKTINSDKHKFFVTVGEKQSLSTIGIQIKQEDIFIGDAGNFNELLVTLFNNGDIKTPFLETNLYAKFKSLIRYFNKHRNLIGFIDTNKNFFTRYLGIWESYFNSYNNNQFKEIINSAKVSIHSAINNDINKINILDQIKQLIEIHNISVIFKEIVEKRIESSNAFIKKQNGINIKSYTYSVIDYLLNTFSFLGYQLDYGVLNAANFGVPQERNRFFIMGIKNIKPTLPNLILTKGEFFNIGQAIKDIEDLEPSFNPKDDLKIKKKHKSNHPLTIYLNANTDEISNHIVTQSTTTALKRFKFLSPGQNFHDLDDSLKTTYSNTKRTQNTIYKRLDYNDVCKTVVNVRKSMWIHPIKNRAISIREAARLQSFPDDYIFIGTKDSQYQQIGNAVPPLLGRAVAEKLLHYLNDKPKSSLKNLLKSEKEAVR
jgi:DNA (cytosine-5)-methyltransferase 1